MKTYIYLAGPIRGKSERGACQWRSTFSDCLALANENFVAVSPLRCEAPGADGNYPVDYDWKLAQSITAKNLLDVRRCDCVLAYLPDANSIGTLQEIGWAVGMGKTIIIVSSDEAVRTHPVLVATVPFIFNPDEHGWGDAIATINGLFEVYS